MSVTCVWALTATVAETLETNADSALAGSRVVTHANFNEGGTLNATSTPPATKAAHFVKALVAGAGTIDFTALTGTNGATVDGTGLKVQIFRVKNLGANNMVITPGASNGIDLLGAAFSLTVFPGAVHEFFLNDLAPDIAAADRTIDIAGTGTQTMEVSVVMG